MNKENKVRIIISIFLLIILLQCILSTRLKSITSDEPDYMFAGYSYIKLGDYRLNPEHPPLMKLISAIPFVFLKPRLETDIDGWEDAKSHRVGLNLLFKRNKSRADKLLFCSRIPTILLSLLLGYYVFLFARKLYNTKTGLFALFLYSFSPNILAHSRLTTNDLAITCFIFIAVYYFWQWLNEMNWKNLIIAGITFGLANATKFTAIYLVFVYFILFIIHSYLKEKTIKNIDYKKTAKQSGLLILIFIIGLFILNSTYVFQDMFNNKQKLEFSETVIGTGISGKISYNILKIIPISKQYLHGFVYSYTRLGIRPSFLMGEHSVGGWWYYFIIAFLIKTPIAMIAFLILSLLFFNKIKNKNIINELFLIIPFIVFFGIFLINHINIGLRHILPIYPFLFIFSAKIINLKNKWILRSIVLLSIWYLIASLFIFPHYLAYFNEFVGGPNNGHNYLIDSNIDWGQDLKGLKQYMKDNDIDNITMSYWGVDSPKYRRIEWNPFFCDIEKKGYFAVSVNSLIGLNKDSSKCLQWIKDYEPIDKIGYSIFIYYIE